MTITIRHASATDADIAQLLDDYFLDRTLSWAEEQGSYQRRPADFTEGVILAVDLDGEAVGVGGLRQVPSDAGSWWEVKHMYIRPEARRRGLARRLLEELEAEATRRGATDVVLDTHHSLEGAVTLYRAAGFEETEPFNDNPNATLWFRKPLAGAR